MGNKTGDPALQEIQGANTLAMEVPDIDSTYGSDNESFEDQKAVENELMNARLQVAFDEQMSIACASPGSPEYYQKVSVLMIAWDMEWDDLQTQKEVRHLFSCQRVNELYSLESD